MDTAFPEVEQAIAGLAGQKYANEKEASLRYAVSQMTRNLMSAQVVRRYAIGTGYSQWLFGAIAWPRLLDPSTRKPFRDDPMDDRENVPLAEFLHYLDEWYHPRRHSTET